MKVNIQDILKDCGLEDQLYPGKRVVSKMPQTGEFKSHCVVYDWRTPNTLRLEVKAGLHGSDLAPKDLKKYPISFQSPTYVDIFTGSEAGNQNEKRKDEEEGDGEASGKGGSGGGRAPKAFAAFSQVVEGKIPSAGEIRKMVVMGKTIAKEAFASVLSALAAQIKSLKVTPVNILANIAKVTKIAPGGRRADEIDPALLQGAKPYRPKEDMFGIINPN